MNKLGYVALMMTVQLAAGCSNDTAVSAGDAAASTNGPAATNGQAIARQQQPVADERLVLAFGDSLYAGYGLRQNEAFPAVLQRELATRGVPSKIVNAGVSGDTTAGGLRRLAFTLDGLERKPDLALVGLGANDVLRGVDPAETRRNLTGILDELKRRGIPVMITGMMAPRNMGNAYTRPFEAIYGDLAKSYDAELDPFFLEGVITNRSLLLADGLHPNAEGIRRIAVRLAPQVAAKLKPDVPA
jgi:acyl-CoA thioesterase-1